MNISVIDRPIVYSPALNDIVLTLDSTDKTFCSMNYVCDLQIDGNTVTRLKLFPNETNGYCSFKVDDLILDYLSDDVYSGLRGATTDSNSLCQFGFLIGTETDGTTGCTGGTFSASVTGLTSGITTFYAWKGGLGFESFYNYDYTDYVVASGASATANPIKFLTNAPSTITTHLGAENYLSFLQTFASGIDALQVIVLDETGSTATYYLPNAYETVGSNVDRRKITMGVGPDNLNRTTLFTISGATVSGPYITATTKEYTITGGTYPTTFTPYTESKTYKLDPSCFRFTPYRILWVNVLGGLDAYTFRGRDITTLTSDRADYTKRAASFQSNNIWGYQLDSRGRITYHNLINKSVKVWSPYLSEEEHMWLSTELKASAINAFVSAINEQESPSFTNFNLPITITNSSTQLQDRKNFDHPRLSLDVDFTFAFPEVTQRG